MENALLHKFRWRLSYCMREIVFKNEVHKVHRLELAPGLDWSRPEVQAELGAVITGQARGRADDSNITVFKPVGMAFEDVVSAKIVLDRVREQGTAQVASW